MREFIATRLEEWAARLLTWANDVRLRDYRRTRQRVTS